MVNEDTIKRALDNRAGKGEAEEVAAYFGTDEGQKRLEAGIDEALMSATEVTKNDVPEEDIYRCIMKELNLRRRRRWMWMAAAAMIPLLILSGVLAFSGLQSSEYSNEMKMAHLTVPSGDKMHVVFQDGSTAVLNSRSSISYPNRFGRRSREVHLEGEAYFNIEKNPKRPFIIKLRDGEVRVYGTSFNLSAYPEDKYLTLALDNGVVEMTVGGNDYKVEPNSVLSFDRRNGSVTVKTGNSLAKSQWRTGSHSFRSASLDEIINTLSRCYDARFSVSADVDSTVLYTFSSSKRNIDDVLDELMIIAPVKVERHNGIYYVSKK